MNGFLRLAAPLLALASLVLSARAQVTFGPVPASAHPERSELAPLSFDAAGAPDVFWAERFEGRAAPLPARPSIVVRLVLQDGRSWEADVAAASERVLDAGSISTTTMQWSQLHRRGEVDLLGVHLIVERRVDQVSLVSLAISNAAIDPRAPEKFPGGIYYQRIEVDVGSGAIVPELVRAGERVVGRRYVITNVPGYFPPRSHFNRRMAIAPFSRSGMRPGLERAQQALDLVGLVLPDAYTGFGGAKLTLPAIDRTKVEAAASARLARLRAALAAGSPSPPVGLMGAALGPFQPAGQTVAGAAGGDGIELLPGWDATRSGALLRRLAHDVEMERHPVAFYDARTGAPLERLPAPQDYRLTRGLGKVTSLVWCTRPADPSNIYDDRRIPRDWNTGACAYRVALLDYQPHDGQHLVRATRNGEAAWWLARDWLARLDLEMVAADARYAWTLHPAPAGGGYTPPGLSVVVQVARAKPGLGTPALGREFGWVCHAWSIDLAASAALTSRSEKLAHGRAALEAAALVAMPTGITQRLRKGEFWGSPDPWIGDGVPFDMDVSQWVLEGPIVSNGITGLARNAVMPTDDLAARAREVVTRWARSAYLNPAIRPAPTPWNVNVVGIPKWAVVAPRDGAPLQSIALAKGGCDPSNSWHHLALAFELTGDVAYLDAMCRLGGVAGDRAARLASFGTSELGQTAAAVSSLQRAANLPTTIRR